jgi:hypothetical protein
VSINRYVLAVEVTVLPVRFELSLLGYALEFPATNVQQNRQNVQGMDKKNGNAIEYRNKSVRVGCTERTLV